MSEEKKIEQLAVSVDVAAELKKPRLVTIIFCDYASLAKDGKANLMGCFDRFFLKASAENTGTFWLYIRTAETWDGEVQFALVNAQNEPVAGFTFNTSEVVPLPSKDRPAFFQFIGQLAFAIAEPGFYWADVSFNGIPLGGTPLTIQYLPEKEEESK